jgi:CDP-diacylglycerol--serine O-phosphatidyltransferase
MLLIISSAIYLLLLPISFIHYQRLKKQNEFENITEDNDDLEDIL